MSDQDPTDQMPAPAPPAKPPPGEPRQPRRLLRSRSDRMLGGVAGGLAEYFNVDALIFRIGFGVSVLFGGLGALAYLALLLFVPAREDDGTPGEAPFQRSRGVLTVAAVALASVVGLSVLAMLAVWAGATGTGELVAAVVIAIGVLLVIAAFRGGARWLIAPALALAIPLGTVSVADLSFAGGVGERDHRPLDAEAIPAKGYELGIGRMEIDLRGIDWAGEDVVELDADLGIGELVVGVPASVCVAGDMRAGVGAVMVGGDESGGFDVGFQPHAGTEATPRLVLDAEIDVGALTVVNDDSADLGEHDHHSGEGDERMTAALAAACAPAPEAEPERGGLE